MKILSVTLVVWLSTLTSLLAQDAVVSSPRFEVRIHAGSALTFVPTFYSQVLMLNGSVVPGLYTPDNGMSAPITFSGDTHTQSAAGWSAEGELHYKLPHNFGLSLSVGAKKLRFDHSTPADETLDLPKKLGKTNLLYLSIKPFNISKSLLKNRLEIQAGPVLNWLLSSDVSNKLVVFYTAEAQTRRKPDQMYFSTPGNIRKRIWGLNAGISYHITGPLYVKASAQYYINSLYRDESWLGLKVGKVKPFVAEAGVMLTPFRF